MCVLCENQNNMANVSAPERLLSVSDILEPPVPKTKSKSTSQTVEMGHLQGVMGESVLHRKFWAYLHTRRDIEPRSPGFTKISQEVRLKVAFIFLSIIACTV